MQKSESSNIKDEIRDLGDIKDIRDKLSIMTVLLHSRTCQPVQPIPLLNSFTPLGKSNSGPRVSSQS